MDCQAALRELESLGTAQNRKIYRRHGVGENLFGVSYANQNKLAKEIKRNHSLARELWTTGNHDARILATMIADPSQTDGFLLDSWVNDLDSYVVTDAFSGLVGKTALAYEKAEEWTRHEAEWPGRAGWHLIAHLAMKNPDLPDAYFTALLAAIEGEIHDRKNRVRDAMNNALIAILYRSPGGHRGRDSRPQEPGQGRDEQRPDRHRHPQRRPGATGPGRRRPHWQGGS